MRKTRIRNRRGTPISDEYAHACRAPTQGPVARVFRPGAFRRQRPGEPANSQRVHEDFNIGLSVTDRMVPNSIRCQLRLDKQASLLRLPSLPGKAQRCDKYMGKPVGSPL